MEINKKIYKYTSIISMTIVLVLILNLIIPSFTKADSESRLSVSFDDNSKIITATGSIAEETTSSAVLYWVESSSSAPSKDDIEAIQTWCLANKIKEEEIQSSTINSTFQVEKDGTYYAVAIIEKTNENGSVYQVLIAYETLQGYFNYDGDLKEDEDDSTENPGKEDDKSEEETGKEDDKSEEETGKEDDKSEEETGKEDDKSEEEPGKEDDKSEEEPGKEDDKSEEEPGKEDDKSEEEPGKEDDKSEEEPGKEDDKPAENPGKEDDDELHININDGLGDNDGEYGDIEDGNLTNKIPENNDKDIVSGNKNEDNKETVSGSKKEDNKVTVQEDKKENNKVIVQESNKVEENMPQTGTNDTVLIIAIITFALIGMGSFVKYKRAK